MSAAQQHAHRAPSHSLLPSLNPQARLGALGRLLPISEVGVQSRQRLAARRLAVRAPRVIERARARPGADQARRRRSPVAACRMGETSEYFTDWNESYESFDQMGLHENLLRGIYAYGASRCRAAAAAGSWPAATALALPRTAAASLRIQLATGRLSARRFAGHVSVAPARRLRRRTWHLPSPAGFEKPSAIQQKGIVPFGKGLDVIQQAQSGTGKTATFCAGILQVGAAAAGHGAGLPLPAAAASQRMHLLFRRLRGPVRWWPVHCGCPLLLVLLLVGSGGAALLTRSGTVAVAVSLWRLGSGHGAGQHARSWHCRMRHADSATQAAAWLRSWAAAALQRHGLYGRGCSAATLWTDACDKGGWSWGLQPASRVKPGSTAERQPCYAMPAAVPCLWQTAWRAVRHPGCSKDKGRRSQCRRQRCSFTPGGALGTMLVAGNSGPASAPPRSVFFYASAASLREVRSTHPPAPPPHPPCHRTWTTPWWSARLWCWPPPVSWPSRSRRWVLPAAFDRRGTEGAHTHQQARSPLRGRHAALIPEGAGGAWPGQQSRQQAAGTCGAMQVLRRCSACAPNLTRHPVAPPFPPTPAGHARPGRLPEREVSRLRGRHLCARGHPHPAGAG